MSENTPPEIPGAGEHDLGRSVPDRYEDVDLSRYKIVPGPDADRLTEAQLAEYRDFREAFVAWLHVEGKDPDRVEGYAPKSVQNTAYRTSKFMRFVWDIEGEYTLQLSHDHADAYLDALAYANASGAHGEKERKALMQLFRWLERAADLEPWEPNRRFSPTQHIRPPDYLSLTEREKIREAALEYGAIPGYNDLTPSDRDRWRAYLAQRLGKPTEAVTPADWDRVNGWKFTSLVWTSLDAGLRPHEVEHARVAWVDVANQLLRIPVADSAKNAEHWHVALTERTTRALGAWLEERRHYDRNTESERIWLTREGNPYTAQSLRRLLIRLCEHAGIPTEDRRMSWYAIRHSVGTYMVRERGLAAAQAQLRHKRPETTMKYDAVPVEDRREALDRMG